MKIAVTELEKIKGGSLLKKKIRNSNWHMLSYLKSKWEIIRKIVGKINLELMVFVWNEDILWGVISI